MRIAVVGTGVVGSYFGGKLAHTREDVVFLARGANLQAIREHGLRVDSVDGDFVVSHVQATAVGNMLRDTMASRPSEMETEIGAIVRLARTVGVEIPCHAFLYTSLLPQERKARGEIEFSV